MATTNLLEEPGTRTNKKATATHRLETPRGADCGLAVKPQVKGPFKAGQKVKIDILGYPEEKPAARGPVLVVTFQSPKKFLVEKTVSSFDNKSDVENDLYKGKIYKLVG